MIYLGIDLGTSSVKILATDDDDKMIGSVTKDYPVSIPKEKWSEQDPLDWWEQTRAGIIELVDTYKLPKDGIKAIGFSGQMHGLVALDKSNQVLFPAILWNDQRTEAECREMTEFFGQQKLTELTGNKALTGFTAPKILWVKKHNKAAFNKISHILLPKDYIRFRLTGEYAMDYSDASGTLLLNVQKKAWSKEICDFIGINDSQLPRLCESYDVTGVVSDEVMNELGLEGNIIVVGGAGDQAAGAVGTGTVEEGIITVTLGTSGVVFAAHNDYVVDEANRLHAFAHANGRYHSMGVMLSAASCLKWWVDEVHPEVGFEQLLKEAAQIAPGSEGLIFLPYLTGERTPYPDPNAKGTFIGLTPLTKRGHMTRAILEGVAFGLKDSLEILKDMGIKINEIRVIGGGAKSLLWKQIVADILDEDLYEINTNQGGALGACILAAVGAGHYSSVSEGCKSMITISNKVEKSSICKERYRKQYIRYQGLYQALKPWFNDSSKSKQ